MNNNRIIAFSLIAITGAILAGLGFIAEAINSYSDGDAAMVIGMAVMSLGILAVLADTFGYMARIVARIGNKDKPINPEHEQEEDGT